MKYDSMIMAHFHISKCDMERSGNRESAALLSEMLEKVGFKLEVTETDLYISADRHIYRYATARNAGPKKKHARKAFSAGEVSFLRYSDIVKALATMKDKDVLKMTGMAPSTYYRHKKALFESDYYRNIDMDRVNEDGYPESLSGNAAF